MDVVTVDLTAGRVAEAEQMRVFLNFGEHGRELITSQVALRLLQLLLSRALPLPLWRTTGATQQGA
jgi:hypothetical protein